MTLLFDPVTRNFAPRVLRRQGPGLATCVCAFGGSAFNADDNNSVPTKSSDRLQTKQPPLSYHTLVELSAPEHECPGPRLKLTSGIQ